MAHESDRRERLHKLIEFARAYRGWSRAELARALNRDSTKLYPNTDNPKLDLIVLLAHVLEWPIEDVVQYIWHGGPTGGCVANGVDFDTLDAHARTAHGAGQYEKMIEIARKMYVTAKSPEERARACNREAGGWDGLGRFTNALEAARRGLQESPISTTRRNQLQANLANAHYTLWDLASSLAHAHVLVEWYEQNPPVDVVNRKTCAFAYYVRGHTYRRMIAGRPEHLVLYCRSARHDLALCARANLTLADELGDERLRGIANTCRAGLIEVAVELGERRPEDAVAALLDSLDAVIDPESQPVGDCLESYGWSCVFGANIALRYLTGRDLQRCMAIFTNKALEIADQLDNWALRERVFTMQYRLHETLVDSTGLELPFTIDDEDRRLITGTMGRFPAFRETGWKIFRTAKLVREENGN